MSETVDAFSKKVDKDTLKYYINSEFKPCLKPECEMDSDGRRVRAGGNEPRRAPPCHGSTAKLNKWRLESNEQDYRY